MYHMKSRIHRFVSFTFLSGLDTFRLGEILGARRVRGVPGTRPGPRGLGQAGHGAHSYCA